MKLMNKITVALVALFCMGNLGAATWRFANNTNKTLIVGLGLKGASFWNYNIIEPGERKEFSWEAPSPWAGWCLSGISWMEYDPKITHALTKNGGLDMYQPGATMLPDDFRLVIAQTEYIKREKRPEVLYVPQERREALKAGFRQVFGALVDVALGDPACHGRDFEMLENDKGNVIFVTNKP